MNEPKLPSRTAATPPVFTGGGEYFSVSHAQLHQPVFVPNCGNLTHTFNGTAMKGVELRYGPLGLKVRYKGVDFLVPVPNVAVVVYS